MEPESIGISAIFSQTEDWQADEPNEIRMIQFHI